MDLMSTQREYRQVFYKILHFCVQPKSFVEVQEEVLSFPEMETAFQPPAILLKWLERSGGIEQTANEGDVRWRTTQAGKRLMEMEEPAVKLRSLVSDRVEFASIYRQLLAYCQTPKTLTEIERELAGNPIMAEHDVYPAYFVDKLEEYGGLIWSEKKWKTTEAGKGVLSKKKI